MSTTGSKLVKLLLAPDKSSAELSITRSPKNGLPTLDDCLAALYAAEIKVEEELTERLQKTIEEIMEEAEVSDADREPIRVLVAEGRPAEHGEDGRVDWYVDQTDEDEVDSEEAVDHYSKCAFVMVETDQKIGLVSEPTNGVDGIDVWGQAISAKPGKEFSIKHDESIMKTADGTLISQVDGVLSRAANKASVKKYLEVDDQVDFSTGNLDFDGDITVRQGIRDNFEVRATGNIELGSLVEAATIEAGGSVFARGGMAGRGDGHLTTGGDLTIKYIDSCVVKVGGDLMIEKELIDCDINVAGSVVSPNASVMGGTMSAVGSVQLAAVGSGSGTETVLHLGRVPALEGKLEKLEEIAEELRGRFEKVEMELSHLSGGMKLTPTQAERQTELMFEQTTYQGQLAKCEASIGTLNEKIQAISTVHLTVSKYLYHRAVLVIGGGRYEVRDDVKGPVTVLRQRDGELVYRVGDNGSNRPLKQICEFRLAA